jgi:hypothetical protein
MRRKYVAMSSASIAAARSPHRLEHGAVAPDLPQDSRQAQLGAGGDQARAQETDGRIVVARLEPAGAQDGARGAGERTDVFADARFGRERQQVAVAAGDELRAAVDDEVAAPIAAHAPAGGVLALEQLDVMPGILQSPGTGEAGDTGADDNDLRHGCGGSDTCVSRAVKPPVLVSASPHLQ